MKIFSSADILLPKVDSMEKWAVIACDQFTSDPAYWQRVRKLAGDSPSTINLILPEVDLGSEREEEKVTEINRTMEAYLKGDVFEAYKDSYIYVERKMEDGTVRKGIVGVIDLESYDYNAGATSQIRATEKTVLERIPPRVRVRKNAVIELPHVIMLCDDDQKVLIEPVTEQKDSFQMLYDFELMEGGNRITGWLVSQEAKAEFEGRFEKYAETVGDKYADLDGTPMVFAVGDGNHSLATAKTCYEELKKNNPGLDLTNHPARYAMVELENIHDEAQKFEPIHRVITKCNHQQLIAELNKAVAVEEAEATEENSFAVKWYAGNEEGVVYLDKAKGQLAVGILQSWLDEYLPAQGGEIDYIHDDDALIGLAKQAEAVGFLLPTMEKGQLFRGVVADGALPRKTFSMGHSREKRYYLECRKISE